MSLADAIAASSCATNLVLLGDPQQLDQPLQGTHPPGAERSALGHVLDGEQVMPERLGLFLDGTWRLHPSICVYTSEVFYSGLLHAHPGRESLAVAGNPPFDGAGIRFISVPHDGHSSEPPEEAGAIAAAVRQLLAQGARWTDARGTSQPLTQDDILIITPYNAQVAALTEALPGFRIGTVDKFQGQEGAGLDLLDGNELSRRRTTGDGVPVQPQPPERRNEQSPMRSCSRRESAHSACALPNASADAARERARSARGVRLHVARSQVLRQFLPRPAAHHPKGGDVWASLREIAIEPARTARRRSRSPGRACARRRARPASGAACPC